MEKWPLHQINEKRSAVRYEVAFFVEFEDGTGWTRNVSSTGACIETDRAIDCGAAIRFYLTQPDRHGGATRVECAGIVVRTEQAGEFWRLGVAMEHVSFSGHVAEKQAAKPPSASVYRFKSERSRTRSQEKSVLSFLIGKRGELS